MSDDGADLNMPAENSMRAVLGGEQPKRLSDEDFERMIRSAEREPVTYDNSANYAARLVLEFLEAHPEHRDTPIEAEGELRDAEGSEPKYVKVRDGLYDVMKEAGIDLSSLELPGFMWGWAANAARHILGLDHQPNPAILTIGS